MWIIFVLLLSYVALNTVSGEQMDVYIKQLTVQKNNDVSENAINITKKDPYEFPYEDGDNITLTCEAATNTDASASLEFKLQQCDHSLLESKSYVMKNILQTTLDKYDHRLRIICEINGFRSPKNDNLSVIFVLKDSTKNYTETNLIPNYITEGQTVRTSSTVQKYKNLEKTFSIIKAGENIFDPITGNDNGTVYTTWFEFNQTHVNAFTKKVFLSKSKIKVFVTQRNQLSKPTSLGTTPSTAPSMTLTPVAIGVIADQNSLAKPTKTTSQVPNAKADNEDLNSLGKPPTTTSQVPNAKADNEVPSSPDKKFLTVTVVASVVSLLVVIFVSIVVYFKYFKKVQTLEEQNCEHIYSEPFHVVYAQVDLDATNSPFPKRSEAPYAEIIGIDRQST